LSSAEAKRRVAFSSFAMPTSGYDEVIVLKKEARSHHVRDGGETKQFIV
jgi:hypothetical protein